ncbi:MAG: NADH:flavin oxidoreductase [Ilumatobacteraceae bacterium]
MTSLFDSVSFAHGPSMPNRFMLAPLTNQQSHADGTLSDDEHHWLTMRARGGFGLTMTCAAHVARTGQGFAGQLGCFDDAHLPGLTRLARDIKVHGSLAIAQLHHAGNRSPADLIGQAPVCPSEDPATGARALTEDEVHGVVDAFVSAAERCDAAGFDGVELHGAHGYLLCQFLSPELNRRTDGYGGSLENRARPIMEIVDGIRSRCRADFNLSVRLSPERFGLRTAEIVDVFQWLVSSGRIDFIDMSLWDVRKPAADEDMAGRGLLEIFSTLERGSTRLAAAGKLYSAEDARWVVENGADMAVIGRGAILHHDFPRQVSADQDFVVRSLPVTRAELRAEGLSESFVGYMKNWPGFVAEE